VEAIDKDRFGVIVASGIGGIKEIEDQVIRLHEKGPKRVKPMTLPKALPNMASGDVAILETKFNRTEGISNCIVR